MINLKILLIGDPHFKPDWSPDTLLSSNYICHFGIYRKEIMDEIGGFSVGYEGSQYYDLVLRLTEKTDTIYHVNGNILTGELTKLAYGVATWKMDGMGTITFDEVHINTIRSRKLFEIKLKDGSIYFGSLDTSATPRMVYIIRETDRKLAKMDEIVEIYPIKRSFWMRMSGNFSLGLNFSKGSDVATLAFSGNIDYRKRRSYFNLAWDDNNTYQADTLSSSKADIALGWQRLLKKGWSAQVLVGASQNSELGTKLRWNLNLIGIKDIAYNNWNRFYAGAGFSALRETPYDDSKIENDIAAYFELVWRVFKYTLPKVWVDANISYLPYLTDTGRQRIVVNMNPQVSILDDNFKIGLSIYYNYDSKPSESASSTDDYGLNLELTYSFH